MEDSLMDVPQENYVSVGNIREANAYIRDHRCRCGNNWQVAFRFQRNDNQPEGIIHDQYLLGCPQCSTTHSVVFVMDVTHPAYLALLAEALAGNVPPAPEEPELPAMPDFTDMLTDLGLGSTQKITTDELAQRIAAKRHVGIALQHVVAPVGVECFTLRFSNSTYTIGLAYQLEPSLASTRLVSHLTRIYLRDADYRLLYAGITAPVLIKLHHTEEFEAAKAWPTGDAIVVLTDVPIVPPFPESDSAHLFERVKAAASNSAQFGALLTDFRERTKRNHIELLAWLGCPSFAAYADLLELSRPTSETYTAWRATATAATQVRADRLDAVMAEIADIGA